MRIRSKGYLVEEAIPQLHRDCQAFEHTQRQSQTVQVKVVQLASETREYAFIWTEIVSEASMFITLFVVLFHAVGFCSIRSIALVDSGVDQFVLQLGLQRKIEERLRLLYLVHEPNGVGQVSLYQLEDVIHSLLWDAMVFDVDPSDSAKG